MFASLVTKAVGFRLMADYVGCFCLVFSIFYFIVGDGISAFNNSRCDNAGHGLAVESSFIYSPMLRGRLASFYSQDINAQYRSA